MDRMHSGTRMDYEWANKQGPVDKGSPFITLAANKQLVLSQNGQKRNYDDASSSEQIPSLRAPAPYATHLFNQPPQKSLFQTAKALPPTPFSKNPNFTTPRKVEIASGYDSSGIENISSPENNADSEATPDNMGFRSQMAKLTGALANMPDKLHSKENMVFKSGRTSPSKAGMLQPLYSHGVEKRRRKNKTELERRLTRRKYSSASDSEDNGKGKEGNAKNVSVAPAGPGTLASFFGFIETHPDLPHILSFYAQLLLNFFLVFLFIYMVYCFWSTIRSDVDKKSEEAITDILAEMAICAQNYRENRCAPETRMPALETVCNNWERCMNKDPRALGRAKVSAHTFAEIFNSFIEPFSWKAIIVSCILIFGCFGISNFAFGYFRNRAHPPVHPSAYMQTPMRHFSGPQEYYWNNYQSPIPQESTQSKGGALDVQTPIRRIQYN